MACICDCGRMKDCDMKLCDYCFLEQCTDDAVKNLCAGGRFYPLAKEAKEASASDDGSH